MTCSHFGKYPSTHYSCYATTPQKMSKAWRHTVCGVVSRETREPFEGSLWLAQCDTLPDPPRAKGQSRNSYTTLLDCSPSKEPLHPPLTHHRCPQHSSAGAA
ncbi:C-type lectin domain family 2 member D-like [Platysternon megacephalum]|uniref:C-type lectin domain family 2 member D-like n=1 Tax=Platysternon megacephalum TaxID=55544 RepID=A0A4D9DPB3_9SAUR|nr:C-type lectin domain family 2 member D-like [Platysternon megacephalum]